MQKEENNNHPRHPLTVNTPFTTLSFIVVFYTFQHCDYLEHPYMPYSIVQQGFPSLLFVIYSYIISLGLLSPFRSSFYISSYLRCVYRHLLDSCSYFSVL